MSDIDPKSTSPLPAVRRLQEDIGRAIMDALERGVSNPQIGYRLAEWARAYGYDRTESQK